MKPFNDSATKPQSDVLFAAGSHLSPHRLAMQRVRAAIGVLVGLSMLTASIAIAAQIDQPLAVLAGVVALVICAIYTVSVWQDVDNVRHALWSRETATGQDIDGDGVVGNPTRTVGHVMRIGTGATQQVVTLPDLHPVPVRESLAGFPAAPAISPNDVVFILNNAAADGLTFRAWDKRRLPSGVVITRSKDNDVWGGILDGLLAWNFAQATTTANGRRIVTLRSDVDVEQMIQQISKSVSAT